MHSMWTSILHSNHSQKSLSNAYTSVIYSLFYNFSKQIRLIIFQVNAHTCAIIAANHLGNGINFRPIKGFIQVPSFFISIKSSGILLFCPRNFAVLHCACKPFLCFRYNSEREKKKPVWYKRAAHISCTLMGPALYRSLQSLMRWIAYSAVFIFALNDGLAKNGNGMWLENWFDPEVWCYSAFWCSGWKMSGFRSGSGFQPSSPTDNELVSVRCSANSFVQKLDVTGYFRLKNVWLQVGLLSRLISLL